MFNIATLGNQAGANVSPGTGNGEANSDTPQGLFSALISLLGDDPSLQTQTFNSTAFGAPSQTSDFSLNLQAGDASLSLSSQALSSAISPENMLGQLPSVLDDFQLDPRLIQGMGELATAAIADNPSSQIANMGSAILGIQEAVQSAPNTAQNIQAGTQQSQLASNLLSLLASADQPVLNAGAQTGEVIAKESNPGQLQSQLQNSQNQVAQSVGANLSGNQQGLTAPLTPEQIAARDPLAADLQRQLSSSAELNQAKINTQTAQTNLAQTNGAQAQGVNNLVATQTQLPFVLTREVVTSAEPLSVAQLTGQGTSQTDQAGLFRPLQASYANNPINLPNMAIEIARNFNAGVNRFLIRLDPPELGRIDVRMQMDDAGNLNARLTVERPETLEFLQRDVRALERALAQAGLDSSRTNLEFELKDNPFGGDNFDDGDNQQDDNLDSDADKNVNDSSLDPTLIAAYRGSVAPGGLSIWV